MTGATSDTTTAIVSDYYNTTAVRSHRASIESYKSWSETQGRRINPRIQSHLAVPAVDLACGTGELLYHLRHLGFTNLTGVDLSADVLSAAREFVPDANFIQQDVANFLLQVEPASLGLVTGLNIVEHLPKQSLVAFFSLVHRALRPGGQFLIVVPNAVSPYGTIPRYWDITHEVSFSPNSVRQLSVAAAFENEPAFFEIGPIPHGILSLIRWVAWKIIRQQIRLRLMIESGSARSNVFTQDMMVSIIK